MTAIRKIAGLAALLWSGTLFTALTEIGSMRLHVTLMVAAFTITLWALGLGLLKTMKAQVYQFDRGYNVGARAVVHGLLDAANRNADVPPQGVRYN